MANVGGKFGVCVIGIKFLFVHVVVLLWVI